MVMIQISRDNGRTWGIERWVSLGPVGTYKRRVTVNRCGRGRDFLIRWRITDPIKVVCAGGGLRAEE